MIYFKTYTNGKKYFVSSSVQVFPCSYRGNNNNTSLDPESRLHTEYNYTNLGLRGITPNNSYLISLAKNENGNIDCIECIIAGYHFKLEDKSEELPPGELSSFKLSDGKYLNIILKSMPLVENNTTTLLSSWIDDLYLDRYFDGTNIFTGLCISNEPIDGGIALQISDGTDIYLGSFLPKIYTGEKGGLKTSADGITYNNNEVVVGKYNLATPEVSILTVGNGYDSDHKANAFEIYNDDHTVENLSTANIKTSIINLDTTTKNSTKDSSGINLKTKAYMVNVDSQTITANSTYIDSNNNGMVEYGPHTNIVIDGLKDKSTKAKDLAIYIETDGTLASDDFTKTSTKTHVPDPSDYVYIFIDNIKFDSKGKCTDLTKSKLTFNTGTAQGQFKINDTNYDIKNLGTNGTPTFNAVSANTFTGDLVGNADTASEFSSAATIQLTGDITGTASGTKNWEIKATIPDNTITTDMVQDSAITTNKLNDLAVTTEKINDGAVTNDKLANTTITIGSTSASLGSTVSSLSGLTSVSALNFTATSDARLKENIVDYLPKQSILDLPIYKYDFKQGPKNNIGCLAQDLKEICPEIVHENKDGYLSIEETKIVYLLLLEVKKLRQELNGLKK